MDNYCDYCGNCSSCQCRQQIRCAQEFWGVHTCHFHCGIGLCYNILPFHILARI
uniref:Uncharacterized protein n=1 Tax=Trichobilharzia regenti TaxID=157069 RepID=A0AA85JX99_TRIRE|nr:unnamed protein product [Trichobilharzia regenti]